MLLLADLERYTARLLRAGEIDAGARDRFEARNTEESFTLVGSTALIQVGGAISYTSDFMSWFYGGSCYTDIQQKLRMANMDPDVKRIVMIFDTPGGDVTGCRETARMIKSSAKPVDAMIDPECASAGLWLASQCRSITSIESGEVGSLGVQSMLRSVYRDLKESGIDIAVIRAAISPDKNLGHPYEEMTDEAKAVRQNRADKWGEAFLADVASGRGVTRDVALEKFGKGKMFYADEAIEVGLIDRIGTLESVLAENQPMQQPKKPSARYAAMRYRD